MKWVCLSLLVLSGCISTPKVKALVAEGTGNTASEAKNKAKAELGLQLSSDIESKCRYSTYSEQKDGNERIRRQNQCDLRVESSDDERWGEWSNLVRCSGEQEGKKHRMTCRLDMAEMQQHLRHQLNPTWDKYQRVQEKLAGGPQGEHEADWIGDYHRVGDLRDKLTPLLDGLNALSLGGEQELQQMAQDQKNLELAADPLRAAKRLRISLEGSAGDVKALKPLLQKTLVHLGIRHDLGRDCVGADTDTVHTHLSLETPCEPNFINGRSTCNLKVHFGTQHCNTSPAYQGTWTANIKGIDYNGKEEFARAKLRTQLHKLKLRDLLRAACHNALPIP